MEQHMVDTCRFGVIVHGRLMPSFLQRVIAIRGNWPASTQALLRVEGSLGCIAAHYMQKSCDLISRKIIIAPTYIYVQVLMVSPINY